MNKASELAAGGPATFGMRILIFSLSVLFLASLVGYVITRQRLGSGVTVTVPDLLYLSTAVLLVTGTCLEMAWRRLRRGAVRPARTLLLATVLTAVLFLAVQAPALMQLLRGHEAAVAEGNPLLGFIFFLVLLHALHVLGGVVALGAVARRSLRRPLIPDQDGPAVRLSSTYWHFLEIVWAAMFLVFLLS
jgi:heme/copper-type cytochrome/quinol oxidase subunit 3